MNRVKHVLTRSALYSLYCTLVMPYLNYFCEVWGNNYKTRIQSLFILQKRAIRMCLNTNYIYAIQNHCFINLDHLTFLTLLTLTAWCLCTRHFTIYYLQICCPTSKKLMTAIIITQERILCFKVRYRRTSKKALSICVKGSKMWNALSADIKLNRNVNVFKKMLKASLLEKF